MALDLHISLSVWVILYFVIGLLFAFAAEIASDSELSFWSYIYSMFLWPLIWLGLLIRRSRRSDE